MSISFSRRQVITIPSMENSDWETSDPTGAPEIFAAKPKMASSCVNTRATRTCSEPQIRMGRGHSRMLVSIAQINLHVGNIEANTRKIIGCINAAREDLHADLVIFPEMTITGYPPEDLLLRPVFLEHAAHALARIASCSAGIGVLIGHPTMKEGRLFNSVSYIKAGEIRATYDKKQLPNYGVFDEKRYFCAGGGTKKILLESIPSALSICEDLWGPEHAKSARDVGAKLLISVNASPFRSNVAEQRKELLRKRA